MDKAESDGHFGWALWRLYSCHSSCYGGCGGHIGDVEDVGPGQASVQAGVITLSFISLCFLLGTESKTFPSGSTALNRIGTFFFYIGKVT